MWDRMPEVSTNKLYESKDEWVTQLKDKDDHREKIFQNTNNKIYVF